MKVLERRTSHVVAAEGGRRMRNAVRACSAACVIFTNMAVPSLARDRAALDLSEAASPCGGTAEEVASCAGTSFENPAAAKLDAGPVLKAARGPLAAALSPARKDLRGLDGGSPVPFPRDNSVATVSPQCRRWPGACWATLVLSPAGTAWDLRGDIGAIPAGALAVVTYAVLAPPAFVADMIGTVVDAPPRSPSPQPEGRPAGW